jgi:signal transduction histidine kinase
MSHELRTPLNAIIGFSEIIKDQVMGPAATKHYVKYAGDIFYSGHHLLALPKDGLSIRGDKPKLRQVLIDLLSNATKFSSDEGLVRLWSEFPVNGELVIVVSDTGIGMSPDEIRIALEPFEQVDNPLVKRYEGAGIGLPLAKRLVELHGGEALGRERQGCRNHGPCLSSCQPCRKT